MEGFTISETISTSQQSYTNQNGPNGQNGNGNFNMNHSVTFTMSGYGTEAQELAAEQAFVTEASQAAAQQLHM